MEVGKTSTHKQRSRYEMKNRKLEIFLTMFVVFVISLICYVASKHRTPKPRLTLGTTALGVVTKTAPNCDNHNPTREGSDGWVFCTADFVPIPPSGETWYRCNGSAWVTDMKYCRQPKALPPTATTGTLGNVSTISGTSTSGFVVLASGTGITLTEARDGCVSPFTYDSQSKLCTLTFATTPNEVHCEKTVANQMICTYVPLDADHPDECKPGECLDGWAPEVQGYLCVKDGKEVKLNEPCGERQLKPAEFPEIVSVQIVATEKQRNAFPGNAWMKPCGPNNHEDACYTPDPVPVCKMPADIDVCPVVQMDKKEAHQ